MPHVQKSYLTENTTIKMNVILLGPAGAGKTSFVNVLRGEKVTDTPTIGVDFQPYKQWRIWDTAGCERFKAVARGYYRKADIALIFFDASKPETYHDAIQWQEDFKLYSDKPTVIVANKADVATASHGIHISCLHNNIQPILQILETQKPTTRITLQPKQTECKCY